MVAQRGRERERGGGQGEGSKGINPKPFLSFVMMSPSVSVYIGAYMNTNGLGPL
jgi:hypothetical protein